MAEKDVAEQEVHIQPTLTTQPLVVKVRGGAA
jgi:hypothetical protein